MFSSTPKYNILGSVYFCLNMNWEIFLGYGVHPRLPANPLVGKILPLKVN